MIAFRRSRASRAIFSPCRLAHVVATAIISGWLGFAGAAAKETPRLIKSGEISLSRWCGNHAVIGDERSGGLLWLDLASGKQVNLSLALPAWKSDEAHRAISVIECSPDGRWILGDYYHFQDGDSSCDRYHDQPPPIVLWDTREGKHHVVGKGYWSFYWAPDGSTLMYHHNDQALQSCDFVSKPKTWFRLPSFVTATRAVAFRGVLRGVLPPSTGWKDDLMSNPKWAGADRFLVELGEKLPTMESEPANGALVLVQMKNGKGLSASQLNPKGFVSPVRLAIPQISSNNSLDLLAAIGCEILGEGWTCTEGHGARVIEELVKLDLQRYCDNPAPGDADKFCEVGQKGLSWSRARRGGSVVLLKKYDAPRLPPAYESRKVLELFIIENDQRGDLK